MRSVPPYRVAAPPPDDVERKPPADPLGAERSIHRRSGVGGLLHKSFTVAVHAEGLRVEEAAAGEPPARDRRDVHFEDIDELYFDFDQIILSFPNIAIVTFDERRIELPSDLSDFETIVSTLKRQVTLPLGREATAAFNAGKRLDFGPIVIHPNGIQARGEEFLPWSELGPIKVDRAWVTIGTQGLWALGRVRVSRIPHPGILLDLLKLRGEVTFEASDAAALARL